MKSQTPDLSVINQCESFTERALVKTFERHYILSKDLIFENFGISNKLISLS